MHLRQPGFTYSACEPFELKTLVLSCACELKTQRKNTKFKESGDSRYIYQNKLDKACFQHDMAYGDFKDLTRRTASDKILRDKTFNIAKSQKYDGYHRGLL